MKNIFLMIGFVFGFILSGCASMKPSDKAIADVVFTETLGAMFDQNPTYKSLVLDLATEAKVALDAHTLITQGGASTWLVNHLQEKFKNDMNTNPRLKRTLFLLAQMYMPSFETSVASFVTPAQKDQLYHVIDLILISVK